MVDSMRRMPAASPDTPGGIYQQMQRFAVWLIARLKLDLPWVEHAILVVRWLAFVSLAYVVIESDRISDYSMVVLLGVTFGYLVALEASARRQTRFRLIALQFSTVVDLLLISWATYALDTSLLILYYLAILIAAIRFGAWQTIVVGTAASILAAVSDASLIWLRAVWVAVPAQSLALLGVGVLAAYLGELREREHREQVRMVNRERARAEVVPLVFHELRDPLAMIKLAAGLLMDELLVADGAGPLTAPQRSFLTNINDSCERVIGLVEDQLARAWAEARGLELNTTLLDVRVPVRRAVRAFRPLAAKKGQTIHLDYPQVVSKIVADGYWLQQVVNNLLSNASKYTYTGGHIYVSLIENQSHLLVSVTDDGAGIPPSERDLVFGPFFRGAGVSAPGTGLGLAIVQIVVAKHGGKVLIDSSLGQGTTLMLVFPKSRFDGDPH